MGAAKQSVCTALFGTNGTNGNTGVGGKMGEEGGGRGHIRRNDGVTVIRIVVLFSI